MKPTDDASDTQDDAALRTDGGEPSDADRDSAELRSDGGSADSIDVFTSTADVPTPTRREKAARLFRRSIYAPLAVAWSDVRTRIAIFILGAFFLMGTVGVWMTPGTTMLGTEPFLTPFTGEWITFEVSHTPPLPIIGVEVPIPFTLNYFLGTDNYGQDMFSTLVHGTPTMLKLISAGALFSVFVGTFVGSVAGYKGGRVDNFLMTITDVVLTIPALALVIVIAAIWMPRDPYVIGIILGIDNWPRLARNLRSQVLSIREEAYTEASRAMGLSKTTILRKDVINNMMPYILVNLAQGSRRIIFESVALYFLGILPYNSTNWGVMLDTAYGAGDITNPEKIHWLLIPMFAIILVSLGFIWFAQGMDRVFNVRIRAKHAQKDAPEDSTAD